MCAGEGAFLIAEQFRFDQRLGQGAAIYFDERLLRSWRVVVNGMSDELFAGAGFAPDQDGRAGMRHLRNLFVDLPHGSRGPYDVGEIVSFL